MPWQPASMRRRRSARPAGPRRRPAGRAGPANSSPQPVVLGRHLLGRVEDVGDVDRRLGDGAGQLEHDGQPALHVRGRRGPTGVAVDAGTARCRSPAPCRCGRPAPGATADRASVRATRLSPTRVDARARARSAARASMWSASACSSRLTEGMSTSSAVSARRSVTGPAQVARAVVAEHVVELGLVVALALGRAGLMTSTHGRPNSPPGNVAGPGGRHRDAPRRDDAPADLLAGLGVDHRDRAGRGCTPAPSTDAVAHPGPLGDDAAAADEAVVADHDRRGVGRLEHAADADAARQVDVGADLGARADRGPRVDHRVRAHPGADVHVARHHHHAAVEERPEPGRRAGHDPHAGRCEVVLERDLVGVLERPELDRGHRRAGGRAAGSPASATRARRPCRRRRSRPPGPRPGRAG